MDGDFSGVSFTEQVEIQYDAIDILNERGQYVCRLHNSAHTYCSLLEEDIDELYKIIKENWYADNN